MPNFDKTGPDGQGPKTGGQTGKCEDAQPQARPLDGRGRGISKGREGRGRMGRFARGLRGRFGRQNNNV